MSAGEYDVRTQDAPHNVLTFFSPMLARKAESQKKGRLVFNLYRGEYVFAEVWNSSSTAVALLNNKSRPEMEIAAADPNRQTTVLYA